jgi:uncharacterized protein (TIGR03084 family)
VAADLVELAADLHAETAALDALLLPLDDAGWTTATPAPGWSVHDQISHLAYFDDATRRAVRDPAWFAGEREHAIVDVDAYTNEIAERFRAMPHTELFAWFHCARDEMLTMFLGMEPKARVPWFGPDMSAPAALTARIMETWAHGQDVADALGVRRPPTRGLRQVAHICVRALPNSFRTHRLPVPDVAVRIVLTGPDGDQWVWDDDDHADGASADSASNSVRGIAEEFCLVATQRRHVADTSLEIVGPVATQWMELAQAFAGPPGRGRQPGQFGP